MLACIGLLGNLLEPTSTMFFGIGFLELLLVLLVVAAPIVVVGWIVSRVIRGASPRGRLPDPDAARLRTELEWTQERLVELDAKLERTDERLEFTERLRSGPQG
jgi:hypothetical protein